MQPVGARTGVVFGLSTPCGHRRVSPGPAPPELGLSEPRRTLTAVTTPAARTRRFASETPLGRTRRARRMTRKLAEVWPDAFTELHVTTPLDLLVATILSAQSTDRGVNLVTPALFAKYPTAADYAAADRAELEEMIHRLLPEQGVSADRPRPGAGRAVRR